MGQLEVTGPGAREGLERILTNDLAITPGQGQYTLMLEDDGGIIDDLIVYALEDRFLLVVNASNIEACRARLADRLPADATLTDRSPETAMLALQGPAWAEVLRPLCARGDAFALDYFSIGEDLVAGVSCQIARTGYTGEDGFEIFCPNGAAMPIWTALIDGGAKPIGLGARDTLRLEAKLCLYGNDIDETTHPYEAGLGWVVKLDTDFVGRDALAKIKETPLERKLVGFEMVGRGIARAGSDVVDADGNVIGRVTSGSPSPTLGKNIGLAYVPRALAKSGTPLVVDIRGKRVEAVVVKTPFYKRPRT